MNQIFSALQAGYTPDRILKYIKKIDPDLAIKVNTAMQAGHSIEQVLSFISKNGKNISKVFDQGKEKGNIYQHARTSVHPALKGAGLFAGALIGGGAGAYALSRAAPQAARALSGELLPAIPKPPPGPLQIGSQSARGQLPAPGQAAIQPPPPSPQGPLPYTNPSAQNRPIRQPTIQPQPQASPSGPSPLTQAQQTLSPTPSTPPKIAPLPEALQKQATAMLQAGNDIDKIEGALKSIQPKVVKEYEKATNEPIRRALEEFAKGSPTSQVTAPTAPSGMAPQEKTPIDEIQSQSDNEISGTIGEESPMKLENVAKKALDKGSTQIPFNKLDDREVDATPEEIEKALKEKPELKSENLGQNPSKKEKGSTVALPSGEIGEISDIRQGIATVNANGKEYRRKLEELIEPPMPEKDLADLFKDLTFAIESKTGEEISRMVNWAGYDPKTNELAFVPHTGALYVYDNISPEDAKQLTSVLSRRKSTGENFMGPWIEGTKSPIGAAMSKLIQKLQKERGGKGNEYKGKYEKIYDAFELPKIEAKAKHSAQKKAEKPVKEKNLESKILQDRFDKISKKLFDLQNKPDKKDWKLQAIHIKNLETLENEKNKAWHELREQLIHEKEMGEINDDIRKEKREAKKPTAY